MDAHSSALIMLALIVSLTKACDRQAIQQCAAYLEPIARQTQSQGLSGLEESEYDRACGVLSHTKACIREATHERCPEIDGLMDAIHYMCGPEGRTLYTETHECMRLVASNLNQEQAIAECNASLHHNLASLSTDHGRGYEQASHSVCQATRNLITCLGMAMENACGKKAARFNHEIMRRMMQASLESRDISCDITPYDTTTMRQGLDDYTIHNATTSEPSYRYQGEPDERRDSTTHNATTSEPSYKYQGEPDERRAIPTDGAPASSAPICSLLLVTSRVVLAFLNGFNDRVYSRR